MIRYLLVLFITIIVFDRAMLMLFSGRAIDQLGAVTKRKLDPLGFWVITGFWLASAIGCIGILLFATYAVFTATGPFGVRAFSWRSDWPLVLILAVACWPAYRAVRSWPARLGRGGHRSAA